MTAPEMSLEFDLLYNNIMSNAAPGINDYEKSILLTKAQEELVQAIYDGSFEGSERMRESLNVLIKTVKYDSASGTEEASYAVDSSSKFFQFPKDAMFIVYEALEVSKSEKCGNDKQLVLVKPTTHDDYYRTINNPFKKARKREALRLNVSIPVENTETKTSKETEMLEIVSTYSNYKYILRYVRKPNPIIISDLLYSLTINGEAKEMDCELSTILHRAIVDRAVQLAIAAYKTVSQDDNN